MLNHRSAGPVRMLLVDDHPIVRPGFISLQRQLDPSLAFYEASDTGSAIEVVARGPRASVGVFTCIR